MPAILALHVHGDDGVERGDDQKEIEHRRERLPVEQQRERRQERGEDVDHRDVPRAFECCSRICRLPIRSATAASARAGQPPVARKPLPSMRRDRLVALIVAVALFMENLNSTVIATSLPAIAADIGTSPLALKLAVTSYLLSLAVFIPMSGWTADRFGARKVFATAIAVFVMGSIGCGLSGSLTH